MISIHREPTIAKPDRSRRLGMKGTWSKAIRTSWPFAGRRVFAYSTSGRFFFRAFPFLGLTYSVLPARTLALTQVSQFLTKNEKGRFEYQALTRRGDRLEACGTTYPVFSRC